MSFPKSQNLPWFDGTILRYLVHWKNKRKEDKLGMPSNLKEEFAKCTKDWKTRIQYDEWHFAKFRDHITKGLTNEQAFNLIPDAINLVLEQNDSWLVGECLQLLLDLAAASNTTEIHPYLSSNWDALGEHASYYGQYYISKLEKLKRWYRIY